MGFIKVRMGFTCPVGNKLYGFSEHHYLWGVSSITPDVIVRALFLADLRDQLLGVGVTHQFTVLSDDDHLRDALILPVKPPNLLLGTIPYYNEKFLVPGGGQDLLYADFPWSNLQLRKEAGLQYNSTMYVACCPDAVQTVDETTPFRFPAFFRAWKAWVAEMLNGWGMKVLDKSGVFPIVPIVGAGRDAIGTLFSTAQPNALPGPRRVHVSPCRVNLFSNGRNVPGRGYLPLGYLDAYPITPTLFRVPGYLGVPPVAYQGKGKVQVLGYTVAPYDHLAVTGFTSEMRNTAFFPATWEPEDPAIAAILSPCGSVMDYLRACYRTRMRLFRDSDLEVWVRWRKCVPGAKPLPYHHLFASRSWVNDTQDLSSWPGPGEVKGAEREPIPVRVARGGRGQCFHGTQDWWENGVPISALSNPVVEVDPNCLCDPDVEVCYWGFGLGDEWTDLWPGVLSSDFVLIDNSETPTNDDAKILITVQLEDAWTSSAIWDDELAWSWSFEPEFPYEVFWNDSFEIDVSLYGDLEPGPVFFLAASISISSLFPSGGW